MLTPTMTRTNEVERRLWAAADNLRANSNLRSHEYSTPLLGLIFLAYADHRFPYSLPSTDNGNHLWVQYISSSLNDQGVTQGGAA